MAAVQWAPMVLRWLNLEVLVMTAYIWLVSISAHLEAALWGWGLMAKYLLSNADGVNITAKERDISGEETPRWRTGGPV